METIKEWLAGIEPEEHRQKLKELFDWIHEQFPFLQEKIAWNQPMFTDHGTYIIGFSASKKHFSIAIEIDGMAHFKDQIANAGYSQTKNLFCIGWKDPVNYDLLHAMILWKLEEKKDIQTFWKP